jgi:transposase-like protein
VSTGRTYTAEQRQAALELYREHGPGEAARRTGIRRGTISMWAKRGGVTVTRNEQTRAAVEAAQLHFKEKRERLRQQMLDKALDALERMDEPHVEFVGQGGRKVKYPKAPAGAYRNYATSMAILVDKLRLELGEATSRDESIRKDRVDQEVERLLAEMDRRDRADART